MQANCALHSLALSYHAAGRVNEGLALLERAMPLDGVHPVTAATMAALLNAAGERRSALDTVSRLEEMSKTRMVSPWHLARAYASVGYFERAFASLQDAIE
jgi:tetratricopeptide (TPR) repeat protein